MLVGLGEWQSVRWGSEEKYFSQCVFSFHHKMPSPLLSSSSWGLPAAHSDPQSALPEERQERGWVCGDKGNDGKGGKWLNGKDIGLKRGCILCGFFKGITHRKTSEGEDGKNASHDSSHWKCVSKNTGVEKTNQVENRNRPKRYEQLLFQSFYVKGKKIM